MVDDLLGPSLDLGVTPLHRVKVQRSRIGATGHGAGSTSAHADAHPGATQLNQQSARRKLDLFCLPGIDRTQTSRNHDGFVVPPLDPRHRLLILAKVPQQIGATEFVVERRPAQGTFNHDLQRAGHVVRTTQRAVPQLGHAETGQTRLGPRATPSRALITDLTPGTRGRAGEGRNRCGVVVRLHLHQHMLQDRVGLVGRCGVARTRDGRNKPLHGVTRHDRGVIGISHHGVLRAGLVRVSNHAKEAVWLGLAIDGELGIENFVAAMLAVGLRKHHQLHVGGVATEFTEVAFEIFDFVLSQRQAPALVGVNQRGATAPQHIDLLKRLRLKLLEQGKALIQGGEDRFSHAVVQEVSQGHQGLLIQISFAQQRSRPLKLDLHQTLDASHRHAAVVRNVGGLGRPGRDCS